MSGILGASYDFWNEDEEDEDSAPIIGVDEQEWLEIVQQLLTSPCTCIYIVQRECTKQPNQVCST